MSGEKSQIHVVLRQFAVSQRLESSRPVGCFENKEGHASFKLGNKKTGENKVTHACTYAPKRPVFASYSVPDASTVQHLQLLDFVLQNRRNRTGVVWEPSEECLKCPSCQQPSTGRGWEQRLAIDMTGPAVLAFQRRDCNTAACGECPEQVKTCLSSARAVLQWTCSLTCGASVSPL